jgi:hypothetical protein
MSPLQIRDEQDNVRYHVSVFGPTTHTATFQTLDQAFAFARAAFAHPVGLSSQGQISRRAVSVTISEELLPQPPKPGPPPQILYGASEQHSNVPTSMTPTAHHHHHTGGVLPLPPRNQPPKSTTG